MTQRTILLVNPNTTHSMTKRMGKAAQAVVADGTKVIATQSATGPVSIEGYFDEAFSVPPMLKVMQDAAENRTQPIDVYVIGCFDDTGLDAARCLLDAPVVGLCQASCMVAQQIANKYAILTTLSRSVPALEKLVHGYGQDRACVKIAASDIPVLGLEGDEGETLEILTARGKQLMQQHDIEALILGCAGMVDLASELQAKLGIPIVEPVTAATTTANALAQLGIQTSKRNGYAVPLAKVFV